MIIRPETKSSLKSKLILLNSALASKDSFLPNCKPPPIRLARPRTAGKFQIDNKFELEINGNSLALPLKNVPQAQKSNLIEILTPSLIYKAKPLKSAKSVAAITRFDMSSVTDGEIPNSKSGRTRFLFSASAK